MKLTVAVEKSFGDFTLRAGFSSTVDRLGIFGRSGSGKSTTAHLVAGLLAPDHGTIELDGEPLFCSQRRINLPPERRRISVVFQHAHLFPHLSVERNLYYGWRRTAAKHRRIDPSDLVDVLDLGELLHRKAETLSGGERQRVALGRAVLANPRLLVMDEPLSALDEGLKYQIIPYLSAVSGRYGLPTLVISHSMNEMRLLTEEVVVLHYGEVADQTTPDALARKRMGWAEGGYVNLLRLRDPRREDGLFVYPFGGQQLQMWAGGEGGSVFELAAREIMLFRGLPEAISARNLLKCKVKKVFDLEHRVGVELDCGGEPLIATVVRQAAEELAIREGEPIWAVIKASAFRRLY